MCQSDSLLTKKKVGPAIFSGYLFGFDKTDPCGMTSMHAAFALKGVEKLELEC